MSRHKESVLNYRKYTPFRVVELDPKRITLDQCKEMLSSHVGKNSTFFIEESDKTTEIIRPQAFIDAEKVDPTDQEVFLARNVTAIKNAKRVFIKIPTIRLHGN